MPGLKKGVASFKLESSQQGAHTYRHRQDIGNGNQMVYSVTIQNTTGNNWAVLTGGFYQGSGRKPEQIQSIEQYDGPMHHTSSFKDAKKKAHSFMKKFSGSPGYNGLLNLAAEASWKHKDHGKYGK